MKAVLQRWGAVMALGWMWMVLLLHLQVEWSLNPQYSYGWVAVVLTVYLGWKRWETRPVPQPEPWGRVTQGLTLALLFLWWPLQLVEEANPDWRLLSWSMTLIVMGLTLIAIRSWGGITWCKHFSFPFLFFLIAVPWPSALENVVIQGLMQAVAAMVVEAVSWGGWYAVQHGNLIELENGVVGVNEACSGVRSLQSTLMVALFLGEIYRFDVMRRFGLLLGGFALAIGGNLARAFFLVWVGIHYQTDQVEVWHDPAGYSALAVSLLGLWGMAWLWSRHSLLTAAMAMPSPVFSAMPVTKFASVGILGWILWVSISVEGWYRWREWNWEKNVVWSAVWPVESPQFRSLIIPETTQALLRYEKGNGASWRDENGILWSAYFMVWEPGQAAAQLARRHSPEVCLPATGRLLRQEPILKKFSVSSLSLPFRHYVFEDQGQPLHVFYCQWQNRGQTESHLVEEADLTWASRLRDAWEGRRHQGQQVLEIALYGPLDDREAERIFAAKIPRMIQVP